MISEDQIHTISGGSAFDSEGSKIGSVGQVYLDDQTGNAAWVTVKTGLFGNSETFVPLHDAEVDGDGVRVPFTKDKVKDAPRVDADKHLDHDEERKLYEYYGVDYDSPAAAPVADREGNHTDHDSHDPKGDHDHTGHDHDHDHTGHDHDHDHDHTGHDHDHDHDHTGHDHDHTGHDHDHDHDRNGDHDRHDNVVEDRVVEDRQDHTQEAGGDDRGTARPASAEPVTRSEEPDRVRKDEVEAAGPRLRKFVVTEEVTITVPVTHEELRMVDDSVDATEADRDRGGHHEGDQRA